MFFSDLVEGFLLDCRVRNLSERTIVGYENCLNHFLDYFGDQPVEDITLIDLRKYSLFLQDRNKFSVGDHPWAEEKDEPLSPWTVHHLLRPVKTIFNWATDEEILEKDPSRKLKLPKLPKGRVDMFSDEEIDELLSYAKTLNYRDYAIVFLLLDSGLRRGELVALNLEDVDVKTGMVTVRKGKGSKWRQVRVGDACKKVLWTYLNQHRRKSDSEAFFASFRDGSQLSGNAVSLILRRIGEELGFRVYTHKFRHTFATNLAKQVPNAFLVAQALGHSEINTAMIYVHLAQADSVDVSPMDAHLGEE